MGESNQNVFISRITGGPSRKNWPKSDITDSGALSVYGSTQTIKITSILSSTLSCYKKQNCVSPTRGQHWRTCVSRCYQEISGVRNQLFNRQSESHFCSRLSFLQVRRDRAGCHTGIMSKRVSVMRVYLHRLFDTKHFNILAAVRRIYNVIVI